MVPAVVSRSTWGLAAHAGATVSATAVAAASKCRIMNGFLLVIRIGDRRKAEGILRRSRDGIANELELGRRCLVSLVEPGDLLVLLGRKLRVDVAEVLVRDGIIWRRPDRQPELVPRRRQLAFLGIQYRE